jgi:hypothetical protein
MEVTTFTCSICGEGSRDICVFCTKDACANHLCERCRRCSDCCECEVRLVEWEAEPETTQAIENDHLVHRANGTG